MFEEIEKELRDDRRDRKSVNSTMSSLNAICSYWSLQLAFLHSWEQLGVRTCIYH